MLDIPMVLLCPPAGAGTREQALGAVAPCEGQEVEHGPGTQPVFVVCASKEAAELEVP